MQSACLVEAGFQDRCFGHPQVRRLFQAFPAAEMQQPIQGGTIKLTCPSMPMKAHGAHRLLCSGTAITISCMAADSRKEANSPR